MMDSVDLLLESGLMLRSISIVAEENDLARIEMLLARKNAGFLRLVAVGCETFVFENRQRETTSGPLCVVIRDISSRGWHALRFEVRELEREAFVVQSRAVDIFEIQA